MVTPLRVLSSMVSVTAAVSNVVLTAGEMAFVAECAAALLVGVTGFVAGSAIALARDGDVSVVDCCG